MSIGVELQSNVDPAEEGFAELAKVSTVKLGLVIAAIALGAYLIYQLTLPFLSAITWALAFAVIIMPLHEQIERKVRWPDLSALLRVSVVAIALAVPLVFVLQRLFREAAAGANTLEKLLTAIDWRDAFGGIPWIMESVDWVMRTFEASRLLGSVAEWLTRNSSNLFLGCIQEAVGFVMAFYALFYLLRDRRQVIVTLIASHHSQPLRQYACYDASPKPCVPLFTGLSPWASSRGRWAG